MGPIDYLKYLLKDYVEILAIFYVALLALVTILYITYLLKKDINKEKSPTMPIEKQKYKASINGNEILFTKTNTLNPLASQILSLLSSKCELYIITQVSTEEEEAIIRSLCLSTGIVPQFVQSHVLLS